MDVESLKKRHVSAEELIDYFSSALPPERAAILELHAAECADCAGEARRIFEWSHRVEHCSAAELGAAWLRAATLRALQRAEDDEPSAESRRRLNHWRTRFDGMARCALEILVDASGARLATGAVQALISTGPWQLSPVAGLRGQTNYTEARIALPTSAAHVSVSHPSSQLVIRLYGWPEETPGDSALLVDLSDEPRVWCGVIRPSPEGGREVCFENVDAGRFSLILGASAVRQPSMLVFTRLHGGRYRITFDRSEAGLRINPLLSTCDVAVSSDVVHHFSTKLASLVDEANRTGQPLDPGPFSGACAGIFDAFLPRGDNRAAAIRAELRSLPPGSPLLIAADDPDVCWELIRESNDSESLGLSFETGRRLSLSEAIAHDRPDSPQAETTGGPRRALIIANPTGDLAESADEARILCQSLEKCGVSCDLLESGDATLGALLDRIGEGYDIIHYAGHVRFDEDAREYVLVLSEEAIFTAGMIRSHLAGSPLVFLNGCESSLIAEGLTGAFLAAGARAVVGSLFRVPDAGARAFAEAFYASAIADLRSLGESMCHARTLLKGRPNLGATWASFVLYGDPCLTMSRGPDELSSLLSGVGITRSDCTAPCLRVLAKALEYARPRSVLGTTELFAALIAGEDPFVRDTLAAHRVGAAEIEKAFGEAISRIPLDRQENFGYLAFVALSGSTQQILGIALRKARAARRRIVEGDLLEAFVEQGGGQTADLLASLGLVVGALLPAGPDQGPPPAFPPPPFAPRRIGPLTDADCSAPAWELLVGASRLGATSSGVLLTSVGLFAGLVGGGSGPAAAGFHRLRLKAPEFLPLSAVVPEGAVPVQCTENASQILLLAHAIAATSLREVTPDDLLKAFVQQGGGRTGTQLQQNGFPLASLTSSLFDRQGILDAGRFSASGESLLRSAREFADQLGHELLGRIHLLYGMLRSGPLVRRLQRQGIDPSILAEMLFAELPRGSAGSLRVDSRTIHSFSWGMLGILFTADDAARQTQKDLITDDLLLSAWAAGGGGASGSFLARNGVSITELL